MVANCYIDVLWDEEEGRRWNQEQKCLVFVVLETMRQKMTLEGLLRRSSDAKVGQVSTHFWRKQAAPLHLVITQQGFVGFLRSDIRQAT